MPTTDRFFHASQKKPPFFEGWYFKHSAGSESVIFIIGVNIDKTQRQGAFLQVLTKSGSWFLPYPYSAFSADEQKLRIQIGRSVFSEYGAELHVESETLKIDGQLHYGDFRKLDKSLYAPSIMGPFSYLSFLECYHDVLSLSHTVSGSLQINGGTVSLNGGTGYIEKDWGSSMPQSWTWFQCNRFETDLSVMLSIGRVPLGNHSFNGLIAVCDTNQRQIRFATYNRARASVLARNGGYSIELSKKNLTLSVQVFPEQGYPILGPVDGQMVRKVIEYPSCRCRVQLFQNSRLLLEEHSRHAGFEHMKRITLKTP